ncbi:hypothetical protein BH11MYX4_BH11MYX4_41650 [soil metagenome]
MMAFDVLFPDLAKSECRTLQPINDPDLPDATFLFREHYCADRDCDCRRVVLAVWWAERREEVASINYSFEPARPPFDDEPQTFLDPLNRQSKLSSALLDQFQRMMANDPGYRERLVRHYEMWKAVVDDPAHPDHHKVRIESHDDPSIRPAFPRQEPVRREGAKVGANDPCPCGSGKKHKKCCRV